MGSPHSIAGVAGCVRTLKFEAKRRRFGNGLKVWGSPKPQTFNGVKYVLTANANCNTVYIHYIYSIYTLYIQYIYTLYIQYIYSIYTVYIQYIYSIYTYYMYFLSEIHVLDFHA